MTLPVDFVEKYEKLLGSEASSFFKAIEEGEAKKSFRYNPNKPNANSVKEDFEAHYEKVPYSPYGYFGKISGKSFYHQAGYVYSQEASAMIVATVAKVQPGEKVLDLCAAPGGKSTGLASDLKGEGLLVANDIIPKRAKVLSQNIERWGVTNAVVMNHSPQDLSPVFPQFFDCVVVDAPCSEEGLFHRKPQAIEQWTKETPIESAKRQREILTEAVKMLKAGGRLIYSTCTFSPEENEEIVSWLVQEQDLEIVPLSFEQTSHGRKEWGSVEGLEGTLRLWPQKGQGEGHFVAQLLKPISENKEIKAPKRKKTKHQDKKKVDLSVYETFREKNHLPKDFDLVLKGEKLWAKPKAFPEVKGLHLLRLGLELGEVKKNRFEPSYALALADLEIKSMPTIALNHEEWKKVVSGEAIPKEGNEGFILLTVDGLPFSYGKQVKGIIKNHFPKGLRFKAE